MEENESIDKVTEQQNMKKQKQKENKYSVTII